MHQLLQVVAVRLQRVTLTAMHKFLGLSAEVAQWPRCRSDAPPFTLDRASGDLTAAVAAHIAAQLDIEVHNREGEREVLFLCGLPFSLSSLSYSSSLSFSSSLSYSLALYVVTIPT